MGLSSKHAVDGSHADWSHEQLLKDVSMEIATQAQASQGRNNHQRQTQQQRQQHFPPLKCPRCDSTNTKFCYYNNYNRSQPRHLCKACKRHWTQGGTLRKVPVGGARRNHKRNKTASTSTTTSNTKNNPPPILDISQPLPSSEGNYGSFIDTLPIQSPLFPAHYYYSEQQQVLAGPTINNSATPNSSIAKNNEGDSSVGGGSIQLLDPSPEWWSSWEHDTVNVNVPYIPDDDL